MFVHLFDNDTHNFISADPIVGPIPITETDGSNPPEFTGKGFVVVTRDLLNRFQSVLKDLSPPERVLGDHVARRFP
jgi:hypothetical protein